MNLPSFLPVRSLYRVSVKASVVMKSPIPFLPGLEDLLLFQLIERLALLDALLDHGAGFDQHLHVLADVVEIRHLAVAGNDFHIGGNLGTTSCSAAIMPSTLPPEAKSMKGNP